MKYAVFMKIPKHIQHLAQKMMMKNIAFEKQKMLRKGIRLMNPDVLIAQDGDDFVHNMVSVRIMFNGYKIPRIIKRLLK